MMRQFFYFVCLSFLHYKIVGVTANDGEDIDFAIAGYLPDYRIRSYLYPQVGDEKRTAMTKPPLTDLMIFSLQPHPRGFFGCCLEEDHYELVEKFVNSFAPSPFPSSPSMRIWVTLGGGGRTAAFPEICADSKLRQRLIGSVINLSSRYSFIGGIDLDFFQPRTMEELKNYSTFLFEAADQWHRHGLKVSLTLHPGQGRYIDPRMYNLLDRIHFMTYDMIRGGGNNYHADISKVRGAVKELMEHGFDGHKVLLGIPAYARHLSNPSQVKAFGEIYDGIQQESESHSSKETTKFLLGDAESSLHSWEGYEWESPTRIREKVDLAKELKLGGVFFWELGQDKTTEEHPRGILLEGAIAANEHVEEALTNQATAEL
mmetsp:Transcript_18233/g.37596  ORF Transcript_18233/g.37596 Transcript_18233/m.37596 type:complete len:373 (-) Transcript_18233:99-1217(-)